MKKEKKINRLRNAAGTYNLCKCLFKYFDGREWLYIRGCSEKLLYAAYDDCNFHIDGFFIRRISDLEKVDTDDCVYAQINRERCVLADISEPYVDLTSWKTVFESLAKQNNFLIIRNDYEEEYFFYIGKIKEVKKNHVVFAWFYDNGVWGEDVKIPYKDITSVQFGDDYARVWQQYMEK